jgi:hypothetical protein
MTNQTKNDTVIPALTNDQIRRSQEITAERDLVRPRAARAFYAARENKVVIVLKNHAELHIPIGQIQGLSQATPQQLDKMQLTTSGNAVHWEELDVQMSIEGLAAGVFGTQQWMRQLKDADAMASAAASHFGRLGGKARTPAKKAAARTNGKMGGRPRRKTEIA